MNELRYFKPEEVVGLDQELCAMLDMARGSAGVPFVLTSTVRTCAGNQAAMGVEHSSHILGLAVDIGLGHLDEGYERDHARKQIVLGLIVAGFKRFFLYAAHVHVDIAPAPDYAQDVMGISATA